jgi:2-polyprenyl-3-methyl-5-hydroxy-6-metoxy-1,4-benzoquinol methylase
MNSEYGEKYRQLYETHWWWRARERAILDALDRQFRGSSSERILDIGCGDGLFFDKLCQFGEVDGVEVCADLVSADNPHRERIHVGPFDDSFQPSRQYTAILMLDVLEHLPDPVAALRKTHSLLAPDGKLLIHVPAFRSLWTNHDVLNQHYTRYDRRSLMGLVQKASLVVERMKYLFYWTCPVKLAIRLKERLTSARPAPPTTPPAAVNRLCYLACRFEQLACRRFAPPFGSSLMAVVAK